MMTRTDTSEAERLLRDLLAVIHRDGGHHAAEHGLAASVEAARAVVLADRDRDALVPRQALIDRAKEMLAGVRERPLMYGGSWEGVEHFILDAVDQLDFALAWPLAPLGQVGVRWNYACSKVHRESSAMLSYTLKYDGVTDEAVIHEKYKAAIDEYLSCDGLYPYWVKHGACGGCHARGYGKEHVTHCSSGCPTWPCAHTDGDAEVARWRDVFNRSTTGAL